MINLGYYAVQEEVSGESVVLSLSSGHLNAIASGGAFDTAEYIAYDFRRNGNSVLLLNAHFADSSDRLLNLSNRTGAGSASQNIRTSNDADVTGSGSIRSFVDNNTISWDANNNSLFDNKSWSLFTTMFFKSTGQNWTLGTRSPWLQIVDTNVNRREIGQDINDNTHFTVEARAVSSRVSSGRGDIIRDETYTDFSARFTNSVISDNTQLFIRRNTSNLTTEWDSNDSGSASALTGTKTVNLLLRDNSKVHDIRVDTAIVAPWNISINQHNNWRNRVPRLRSEGISASGNGNYTCVAFGYTNGALVATVTSNIISV